MMHASVASVWRTHIRIQDCPPMIFLNPSTATSRHRRAQHPRRPRRGARALPRDPRHADAEPVVLAAAKPLGAARAALGGARRRAHGAGRIPPPSLSLGVCVRPSALARPCAPVRALCVSACVCAPLRSLAPARPCAPCAPLCVCVRPCACSPRGVRDGASEREDCRVSNHSTTEGREGA